MKTIVVAEAAKKLSLSFVIALLSKTMHVALTSK